MREDWVVLDPQDVEHAVTQLTMNYELDADTAEFLRRILRCFPRRALLYVDESNTLFYKQTPLVDRFTFNMKSDELILFASDPMTFIDAMIEMAMYLVGFATMIGVDESWKVEFVIGAWKPVKNRIKRELGIPVIDEPLWVVGLPPEPEDATPEDPHPFQTLVSALDMASFAQMVRLAARDDVEVNFPKGSDPRVIQVYIRVKTAIDQVADGISLNDWREFNRRLLVTVQDFEDEYRPDDLPMPAWWDRASDAQSSGESQQVSRADETASGLSDDTADLRFSYLDPDDLPDAQRQDVSDLAQDHADSDSQSDEDAWNPFESYLDELLGDDE